MTEDIVVAIVLKNHRKPGALFTPCYCRKSEDGGLEILETLSAAKPPEPKPGNEWLANLHQIALRLDLSLMARKYGGKCKSVAEFFQTLDDSTLQKVILPAIWKETDRLIQIARQYEIPCFDGKYWPALHPSHTINLSSEKATLHLSFDRKTDETIYTLELWCGDRQFNLQHPDFLLLSLEPCYFVVKSSLYHLDCEISGKLLKPFLIKNSISIPARAEHEYFRKFIRKVANRVNIEASGFEFHDLEVQPTAIISIENNWQGFAGITLYFDYGEQKVLANNPQQTFTKLIINDENYVFRRFRRIPEWENTMIAALISKGLKEHGAFYRFDEGDPRLVMNNFIEFASDCKADWEDFGFRIIQNNDIQYIISKVMLKYRHTCRNDWFDLFLDVKIGEHIVPFINFRDHILSGNNLFRLPTGEYFVLPAEWFAQYKTLMIHAKVQSGSIKLHKHHFRLLQTFNIPEVNELGTSLAETAIETIPRLNCVVLRHYQFYGFLWLRRLMHHNFGALLADDMGLGKTLQVLALLSAYFGDTKPSQIISKQTEQWPGRQLDLFAGPENSQNIDSHSENPSFSPALVIVPTSILHHWEQEIRKFAPHLSSYLYYGAHRDPKMLSQGAAHIVLSTYSTIRNDFHLLAGMVFSFIILDESQYIKNPHAATSQAVFTLVAQHRIALSGTPIENHLKDLWSQFHFLNPGLLPSLTDFIRYYANPLLKDPENTVGKSLLELIQPFLLRRTKAQVESELPPLIETVIYCDMSEEQQRLYEIEKSYCRNLIFEKYEPYKSENNSAILVLRAMMRLRQFANHPRMLGDEFDESSGKFITVSETLQSIVSEGHKVVVFSSFVSHLRIYEQLLRANQIRFVQLTGSTTKRDSVVEKFRNDPEVQIFLISLKAGGVGLNLVEADYVLMLDPWWNPAAEAQAINRAHRIGQNKKVFVYRFVTRNTIEEKMLELQKQKTQLASAFIREEQLRTGLSREEMLELLA